MFLDALDRAMDRIGQNPEQYPRHDFGTQRIALRHFPFVIVFKKAVASVEDHRESLTVAAVRATGASAGDKLGG
jgi:hypothetical protein